MAAGLLALQAAVLVALAGYYLAELASGGGADTTQVVMSAVVILVFAAGLALLAGQVWRAASWARTGAGVWQVLLVPVGLGLVQGGQPLLGALVLAVAAATLGALAADRSRTRARPRPGP